MIHVLTKTVRSIYFLTLLKKDNKDINLLNREKSHNMQLYNAAYFIDTYLITSQLFELPALTKPPQLQF